MDELDFGIIRELLVGANLRPGPEKPTVDAIAASLGAHPSTVTMRLRRMERQHVFLPLTLQVTPGIGMQFASVFFPFDQARMDARIRQGIMGTPCMGTLVEFTDGFQVLMYAPDRAIFERAVQDIGRLVPESRPEYVTSSWAMWPSQEVIRIKRHDPVILQMLAGDARTPAAVMAKKLGVTKRTIELRLKAMRDVHGIMAIVGGKATPEGMAMGLFVVDLAPGPAQAKTLDRVAALCSNYFYRSMTPPTARFAVYAKSTSAILEQAAQVRAVAGATRVQARIVARWTVNPKFPEYLRRAMALVASRQVPQAPILAKA